VIGVEVGDDLEAANDRDDGPFQVLDEYPFLRESMSIVDRARVGLA
jgi:hypothetical protein